MRRLGAAALRTGGGAEDVDLHVITRRLEEGKLVRSEDRAMNRHAAGPRGARRWLPPERARGDAHAAELRLDGARGADGDAGGGGRGHGFGHHVPRDRQDAAAAGGSGAWAHAATEGGPGWTGLLRLRRVAARVAAAGSAGLPASDRAAARELSESVGPPRQDRGAIAFEDLNFRLKLVTTPKIGR